jgi:hypothetical protein
MNDKDQSELRHLALRLSLVVVSSLLGQAQPVQTPSQNGDGSTYASRPNSWHCKVGQHANSGRRNFCFSGGCWPKNRDLD